MSDLVPTKSGIFPAECIILNTASRQIHVYYPELQVTLTSTRSALSSAVLPPELDVFLTVHHELTVY